MAVSRWDVWLANLDPVVVPSLNSRGTEVERWYEHSLGKIEPSSKPNLVFLVSQPRFGRRLAHAHPSANEF
jgi:hypothetical protein